MKLNITQMVNYLYIFVQTTIQESTTSSLIINHGINVYGRLLEGCNQYWIVITSRNIHPLDIRTLNLANIGTGHNLVLIKIRMYVQKLRKPKKQYMKRLEQEPKDGQCVCILYNSITTFLHWFYTWESQWSSTKQKPLRMGRIAS